MNPPWFPTGEPSPSSSENTIGGFPIAPPLFPTSEPSPSSSEKEAQLQLPHPPPHKKRKTIESHNIKKQPPLPPKPRKIYDVPPRVINAKPSEFKDIVQRLTGLPPKEKETTASTEITSSTEKERSSTSHETTSELEALPPFPPFVYAPEYDPLASYGDEFWSREKERSCTSQSRSDETTSSSMYGEGVEMGPFPGILSSEPETLPPINPNLFSPGNLPPINPDVFSPEWDPLASYCDEFWATNPLEDPNSSNRFD